MSSAPHAASFEDDVRKDELEHVQGSRGPAGIPDAAPLAGLALSGGGIRSATFNLGLLQALAQARKLRRFDYLSTVSGGGYIGGWLTAWIRRQGLDNVERQLGDSVRGLKPEPDEVRWLRAYSNYLTPRTGLLSIDTLWGGSTYVRNLITNQLLLFALIAMVLVAGGAANAALLSFSVDFPRAVWSAGAILLLAAAPLVGFELALLRGQYPRKWAKGLVCWLQDNKSHWHIAVLTVLGATMMAYALAQDEFQFAIEGDPVPHALPALVFPAFWAIAALTVASTFERSDDPAQASVIRPQWLWIAWLAIASALFAVFQAAYALEVSRLTAVHEWLTALIGPPLFIAAFELAILILIALAGRTLRPFTHDWLSRMAAVIILISVMPVAVFASWILLAPTIDYLQSEARTLLSTMTIGWIATTVLGVLGGKSAATGATRDPKWFHKLLPLAPFVFVIGLFALLVWITREVLLFSAGLQPTLVEAKDVGSWTEAARNNLQLLETVPGENWAWATTILSALALLLAWRVDINLFSFHAYYRNRLSHAYLGASARKRKANAFTRYAPGDSPHLYALAKMLDGKLDEHKATDEDGTPIRPYPLINTALNMSGRPRMEWQQRKAASFVFSPLYCGYELTAPLADNRDPAACPTSGPPQEGLVKAHRPTKDFIAKQKGGHIAHALAITISGAAASPNMGYHTSPAMAALMTAFNVRLGWWLPNPRIAAAWAKGGPSFSVAWMVKELMANANEETRYVYLSDGGHFENLGVYELLRRRCKLIVASDASADARFSFEDLANLVHKARADLRIEIDADAADIRPTIDPGGVIGTSKISHLIAEITYPPDPSATVLATETGWLVYVKSSLPPKLPADVENYRWTRPGFPHQSTADQWFDETQFEAYRRLGLEIGRALVADLGAVTTQAKVGW